MKRQKQESIWASFSRQQKPLVKRIKGASRQSEDSARCVRGLSAIGPLDAEQSSTQDDDDAGDEADGSVTDADLLSSQEDAVTAVSVSCERTNRRLPAAVAPADDTSLASQESKRELLQEILLHPTKDVKDSVHGIISFEPICWRIIDTLQFQRLRNLHQLGAAASVYIGATHTRFEHCLGVAYLAEKMASSIRVHQPYLGITARDVLCIKIAGLCHDLGHGPFSHVFDGIYMKQLQRRGLGEESLHWTHEQGSLDVFDHLLRANQIDVAQYGLEEIDVVFIKELIYGGPLPGSEQLRGRTDRDQLFLYDFVNNAKSGLDVDKLDYFMRDARQTGAKASCDVDILIRNARVLVDRDDPNLALSICFPEKLAGQVMQAFRTRFELHQTVYQHKHVRAAEYMLCDALLAANDHLLIKNSRISEIVNHVEAYQHLDDRVLARIEESDSKELAKARAIRMRMLTRNCYDFVGTTTTTAYSKPLTEDRLLNEILCASPDRSLIQQSDDIIVEFVHVHFGKKAEDPVAHVRFYSKACRGSDTCYQLPAESYEMHRPQSFQDFSIRVFVKQKYLVKPVREAFTLWCHQRNGSNVRPRTIHDE